MATNDDDDNADDNDDNDRDDDDDADLALEAPLYFQIARRSRTQNPLISTKTHMYVQNSARTETISHSRD